MGAYDDILADLPKAKGTYDDILEPITNPPSLKDKLYKTLNNVFQPGSVVIAPTEPLPSPVSNPLIPTRTDGVVDEIFSNARKPAELKPGARIVDGLPGVLEVGARKGYAGLGRIEAGAIKALADVLGSSTLSDIAAGQQRRAGQIEDSAILRGTPVEGFSNESIIQDVPAAGANAVSSVIQSLPALATGPAALPVLFGTTAAQEYGAGREQGLEGGGALLRALPMAGFEVAGEKLGRFEKLADGLRAATRGGGVADLANAMVASSLKELPSEELTTLGQFGVDKLPGIGTNQEATAADLGQQLKDTALATLLQSGAMGAGGSALNTVANRQPQTIEGDFTVDPPAVEQATPAAAPGQDSSDILGALQAARDLVNTPTQPIVETPVVTEAPAPVEAATPGTYDDILNELPQGETQNVPVENPQVPAQSVEAPVAEPQGSVPSDADRGIDVLQQPIGDTGADSISAGQNNDDGAIAGRQDAVEEGPAAPFEDASMPHSSEIKRINKQSHPLNSYGKTLYRETSIDAIKKFAGLRSQNMNAESVYLANKPEIAIGQDANKGVDLEFDSSKLNGKVNASKPGWEALWDGSGVGELIGTNGQNSYADALQKITIKDGESDEAKLFNGANQHRLEALGFTRRQVGKSIVYERNADQSASIPETEPATTPAAEDGGRDNPTQQRIIDKQDALRAWLPDLDWATVGGRMVRDENDKVTRTTWEPKDYNFEAIRSALGTSYTYMQKAVQKGLRGEKLGKKEQAVLDELMDFHDAMSPSAADAWSLASQEEQDQANQILSDEAWHDFVAQNAITDDIANTISQYYESESNANLQAARDDNGTDRQAESPIGQSTGEATAGVREAPGETNAGRPEVDSSQPRTGTGSQNEPAISAPDEGIKRHVESLVKRRAAANQLGKSKQFDVALQLAKDLMNGEAVSPIKFKNAANAMKGDQQLADIFNDLHQIAKAPAKERKAVKTNLIETYKQRIADADSSEALTALAKEIQDDTNLTDQQAQDLDDVVFDAQDRYVEPDDDAGLSFSNRAKSSNEELTAEAKKYFGITTDPLETGYVLPDGTMLDMTGRHETSKDNWPYMKGERSVDHRQLFGENIHNGASLDKLLEAKNGNDAMREFMGKTGAMRVDINSGVADIMGKPSDKQIQWLKKETEDSLYLAISYVDPATGRIIDETELEEPQGKDIDAFFKQAELKTVDPRAPLFSASTPAGGMTVAQVRAAIAKDIFNQEVDVYQSIDDAPDYIKTQAKSEGADGVEGFFDGRTNRVALIANNLPNVKRAQAVARHELIGHYGLENMVGKELMQRLSARVLAAEKAGNKAIKDAAKLVDETQPGLSDYRRGKEIIAVMAERNLHNNIVKRVMDAIRKFLKDHGFTKEDITDVRIAQLLRDATEYLKAKEKGIADSETTDFSKSKPVTVDSRDNWLFRRDELGRIQLAPTGKAYDLAATVTQNLADKVGFGMASPELRKQIRHFKADMQKAMDTAQKVAKTMGKMTVEERSLVSDVVEQMVKTGVTPPEHVMKVAAAMSQTMDAQTSELVDLGMLAKDTAERWRGKYLPRFYNREKDPSLNTLGKKLLRTALPVRGLGGGSLKGRGLYQEIELAELPAFEQLGWEVRDPMFKKTQGKLELVDATKVRDTEKVMIWRDFSPEEREAMGENRDALFRFVMGYTAMQNDIALGRLFDAIAKNQEWTRSRPSEGYTKIPDSEIAETGGVKRYGNLAGLYVRDDIIQHITQYEESGELLKFYRKALSFWKMGKTVLNPVSHMNNVVSNLTMAHFAGVSYWDTHKYIGAIRDFVKGSPYLDEAKDVGLLTGDITRTELLANMPADIKALMGQQDSKITKSAQMTYKVLTFGLVRPMSAAYRFEDDFFKYLIYRDARESGASPDDAVDYATRYIFNYDDLPRSARAVRDSLIPFFAYTYKAAPALAHTLANYPWRFAAPAMAIAGLNAIAYGLIAGDDDDDLAEKLAKGKELEAEERKNLPPWMQGKSALGTEKTIRLGNDPRTGLPLYWDVSRFIPGGDMFDINNQVEGAPLPAPIMPSNPVLITIAAMLWNKDTFTGKDVTDTNDTSAEKAQKRGEWLIKQISPAIAPTGYHADRLMQAGADMADTTIETPFKDYTGKGKDGLPVQAKYAIPQTLGIKVKPTDLEFSAEIAQGQDRKEIGTIRGELRQAARLLDKGAISQRSYDETEAAAMKKIDAILEKD